jgi:hypothetical protein
MILVSKEVCEHNASDVFLDTSLSGIAQLDMAVHGEPYATVGRLSLYAREKSGGHGGRSLQWALVEDRLDPVANIALLRRSINVVLKYKACGLSVSQVYDQIEELFGYVDHKLCVGALRDGDVVVYFRKNDTKAITTLDLKGVRIHLSQLEIVQKFTPPQAFFPTFSIHSQFQHLKINNPKNKSFPPNFPPQITLSYSIKIKSNSQIYFSSYSKKILFLLIQNKI